ncbi:chalcone isomerase family protein [Hydrogenophaga sp.]|uniref:chalcone isomerase family protein n=1 Tax=Hydrogenophaga sp. TaxID=1904254 RepID=UPI003561DD3C
MHRSAPDPRRRRLTGAALCLALGPVLANTGRAAPVPAEVAATLAEPRLMGSATLRFFGLKIYQARLWTEAGFAANAFQRHTFALELQYARALNGPEIAERSLKEMRRENTLDAARSQAWQTAMQAAFPDVVEGDRLTGLYRPGQATPFYFNGQLRSTVDDPSFGPAFFGIWLSPGTSEPDLRRRLLGAAS